MAALALQVFNIFKYKVDMSTFGKQKFIPPLIPPDCACY